MTSLFDNIVDRLASHGHTAPTDRELNDAANQVCDDRFDSLVMAEQIMHNRRRVLFNGE